MKFKFALYADFNEPSTIDTRSYSSPQTAGKLGLNRLIQLADKHLEPYTLQRDTSTTLDNVTGVTAVYSGNDPNREGECICMEIDRG